MRRSVRVCSKAISFELVVFQATVFGALDELIWNAGTLERAPDSKQSRIRGPIPAKPKLLIVR